MFQKVTNGNKSLELHKILEMLAQNATSLETQAQTLQLAPVTNLTDAETLLKETKAAYDLINRLTSPPIHLAASIKIPVERAKNQGLLTTKELLAIASLLKTTQQIKNWRKNAENFKTVLDELFDSLTPNKYLEQKISTSILSESEIADQASDALASIRRKIRASSNKIREQLDKMIHSSAYQKYLQDPIVTIRDGRFVVPVKAEHRLDVSGLVHDTSASGGTVFLEPMSVVEANNEVKVLQLDEQKEIEKILQSLSGEVGTFADALLLNQSLLFKLDIIFAKAKLAQRMKATPPKINETGQVILKKARHPLIAEEKVVPIDISIGQKFDSLVITGPNTGGKTVAIKVLGLLSLMACLGLFLPTEDGSEVAVFEQILVDIGDEQSIEQSLSTFSAHISNIKNIMDQSNSRSLILLDELGAGTDPVEGAAIAVSILENLRSTGAVIAVTTHYAELKEYALSTPGVENASCEFDTETLSPTYRLIIGTPGRSNAFVISEKLGIKKQVITRAKEIISSEKKKLETLFANLEQKRQQAEAEHSKQQELTEQIQTKEIEITEKLQKVQKQNEVYVQRAQEKAKKIVEKAKRQADALLEELETLRKKKQDISAEEKSRLKAQIKSLEKTADPVVEKSNKDYTLPRTLKKGDLVLIVDLDQNATVLEPADSSGSVLLKAGIISTRVNVSKLRLLETNNSAITFKSTHTTKKGISGKAEAKVTKEIDLRGYTAMEAEIELDKFIDAAILSGISELTIIHGKGTGALRQKIHEYLKKHTCIKNFRLGVFGEGESGVTVAQIK